MLWCHISKGYFSQIKQNTFFFFWFGLLMSFCCQGLTGYTYWNLSVSFVITEKRKRKNLIKGKFTFQKEVWDSHATLVSVIICGHFLPWLGSGLVSVCISSNRVLTSFTVLKLDRNTGKLFRPIFFSVNLCCGTCSEAWTILGRHTEGRQLCEVVRGFPEKI